MPRTNKNNFKSRLLTWASIAGAILLAATWTIAPAQARADNERTAENDGSSTEGGLDRLFFKSNTEVKGRILEETETTIKFEVLHAGGIKAVTTFNKSDILKIERGSASADAASKVSADEDDAAGAKPTKKAERGSKDDKDKLKGTASSSDDPTAARLYLLKLDGRFGFDVAKTPISQALEEADKYFNDLVDGTGHMKGKKVVDPEKRDLNIIVVKVSSFSEQGFGVVFQSEDIAPALEHEIVEKGRKVVFWVDVALGGAALLPWVSPHMYFTPTGRLGGIADLDEFTRGDKMVDEKLIGAFLGHAAGFANKGGYNDHLDVLRAMVRKQYWLYVKFEGGKPIYLDRKIKPEDGEGWTLLSDDGEGENKDKQQLIGNDMFILEPDWALKLGISDGTYDTLDDLAHALGVQKNYIEISGKENRGQRALDQWKDEIQKAVETLNGDPFGIIGFQDLPLGDLWEDYAEVRVQGDFNERKRGRGQQINLLLRARSLLKKFEEVLDPTGTAKAAIDSEIAKIKLDAERDARDNRGANR